MPSASLQILIGFPGIGNRHSLPGASPIWRLRPPLFSTPTVLTAADAVSHERGRVGYIIVRAEELESAAQVLDTVAGKGNRLEPSGI